MLETAATLFGNQTPVDMNHIWPFVASLAKELRTETYTMLRQNIHREISKAAHRIVVLWEVRSSTSLHRDTQEDRKLLSDILRYAERRGTKHRDTPEYPEGAPGDLRLLLDAEIDDWHRLFQELFPWAYARAYALSNTQVLYQIFENEASLGMDASAAATAPVVSGRIVSQTGV